MLRRRALHAAIGAALLATGGRPAAAACAVAVRATIDLRLTPEGWLVPLVLNGHEVPFMLDTGSERSAIYEDAASVLGLQRDQWVATTMRGIGGTVRRPNADPRTLTLAGLALHRHTLAGDISLAVLPRDQLPQNGLAGLLGRDLLGSFDLDIDGPANRLYLETSAGCALGQGPVAPPWPDGYDTIATARAPRGAVLVPVAIDGRMLRALIDSGAARSLVTARGMAALGLDAAQPGDPTARIRGIGPAAVAVHRHRFGTVVIGTRISRGAEFLVGAVTVQPDADLVLGRDWLARQRILLSATSATLFISRHAQ